MLRLNLITTNILGMSRVKTVELATEDLPVVVCCDGEFYILLMDSISHIMSGLEKIVNADYKNIDVVNV